MSKRIHCEVDKVDYVELGLDNVGLGISITQGRNCGIYLSKHKAKELVAILQELIKEM